MLACWSRECEDRPSFQTLSEELFDMQKEEQPYVNVDPSQDFILPPTAGRGMKQHDEIDEYIVNGIINVNCIFGENLLNARLYLLYHSFLLTNLFFPFQTLLETSLLSVTGRSVGRPRITTKLK